jgi:hypothetical protein
MAGCEAVASLGLCGWPACVKDTRRARAALRRITYCALLMLLKFALWSSPKKFRFRKFWRSYLDQNLLRITNPVSDLTGDQYYRIFVCI